MKITDYIHKETIIPELTATDKKGVLKELSLPISEKTGIKHESIVSVLLEREHLGSTGIGEGIGIPHGKLKELDELIIGFGLSRKGVDFESIDDVPAHLFFIILTPENSTGLHLRLLAGVSRMLRNHMFKEKLQQSRSVDEIFNIISLEDEDS